jgi:hypothetical protein
MRAVVRCHVTRKEYHIDLPRTARDVAQYWRKTIAVQCPHCGERHLEGFRQLYVAAVFDGGNGSEVIEARPARKRRRKSPGS